MALAAASSYLTERRDHRPRKEDEPPWRLPLHHVQDLRDVARGVEETNAGVGCRYLVDQMASPGRVDVDEDGYIHHLEQVERFCDRYDVWRHPRVANWRMRITRARKALDRMRRAAEHDAIAILHVAFGYPDPMLLAMPELSGLGDVASLARYTAHVEERRLEMVRREAAARPGDPPSLSRVRERAIWADRMISSSDALRAALVAFPEPMPPTSSKEPKHVHEAKVAARTQRRHAFENRRDAFVLEVKLEATRMLMGAEGVYHAAWLACP